VAAEAASEGFDASARLFGRSGAEIGAERLREAALEPVPLPRLG
jgi:hypothetical protein